MRGEKNVFWEWKFERGFTLLRNYKFITSLENQGIQGIPGSKLMKFAGTINFEDAELMLQAVEQDCRRVDIDEW